jgi:hypothetical protein
VAIVVSATVSTVGLPRADAVEPGTILAAAGAAFTAIQALRSGTLTLPQATDRIVAAIGQARTQILAEIDLLAVADAKACARTAVTDLSDIALFTPDTMQAFARDTLMCVNTHDARMGVSERAALDQLGFSLDIIGPIAMLARAHVGFNTADVRATLINDNNIVVSRLAPSCWSTPLTGDSEPGSPTVEYQLNCVAYNGDVGIDHVVGSRRKPPKIDFTYAIGVATRNTSRPLALQALSTL